MTIRNPVSTLRLCQVQWEEIRRHGEETYPHESCGVLLGHADDNGSTATEAVRAENTRIDSAHNRYQIAPQELIRIQREGRKRGLDIIGFYHSHPDHPAQWSRTDLAEAHWFGCSYVITSVMGGPEHGKSGCRATDTNAFLLTGVGEEDKRLEPQPIDLLTGSPQTADDELCTPA